MPDRDAADEKQRHVDEEVKPIGADVRQGQNFEGEYHLFDQVGIAHNQMGRSRDRFGKNVKNRQAEKHSEGKIGGTFTFVSAEAAAKNEAEHGHVQRQHQEGIQHQPHHAQVAAAVAHFDGADGKLPPQFALPGKMGNEGFKFGGHAKADVSMTEARRTQIKIAAGPE